MSKARIFLLGWERPSCSLVGAHFRVEPAPTSVSNRTADEPGSEPHRNSKVAIKAYFASNRVNSIAVEAVEQQISSICRARASALTFRASIVDASGCCFSSSWMRWLNEASSRYSRSISAFFSMGPGFRALLACITYPPVMLSPL